MIHLTNYNYANFKISKSIFIFMVLEISSKYIHVGYVCRYDDLLSF